MNFDFELLNYFKYLKLNIIYKSQIKYEDIFFYSNEKFKEMNQQNISRILSFFFSLETNFYNIKIIKETLNETLESSKINRDEYKNIHLLPLFVNWLPIFIRGKLKLEMNLKTVFDQFISEEYKELFFIPFELFLYFSETLITIFNSYLDMTSEDIEKLKLDDEIKINFAIPKYKNGLTILYNIPHFSKALAEQQKVLEKNCLIY